MSLIGTLFIRNIRVLLRHRLALGIIIGSPILLLILFLGCFRGQLANMVGDRMTQASVQWAYGVADTWIFATVAVLTGFTTGMALMTSFVEDRRAGRFELYRLSRVKVIPLILAYLLTVFVVILVVAVVIVILGQIWVAVLGQPVMSVFGWLALLGGLLLVAAFFAGLAALVASFSMPAVAITAYGALGLVCVGFLSFAFAVPQLYDLGLAVGILPFAQAAALIRMPQLTPILDSYAASSAGSVPIAELHRSLGDSITINSGSTWPVAVTVVVLVLWMVIVVGGSIWRLDRVLNRH
ncbi:MAG: hypothetical protein LBV06_08520 [Propionibacteriaceae bacterium]|jgi:hypothetical protein|nr:hypothetical protein [Propionibacteriaceae bacterium]